MPKLAKRSEIRFFENTRWVNTILVEQRSFAEMEEIANRFVLGGPAGQLKEAQFWSCLRGKQWYHLKHVIRADRRVSV